MSFLWLFIYYTAPLRGRSPLSARAGRARGTRRAGKKNSHRAPHTATNNNG